MTSVHDATFVKGLFAQEQEEYEDFLYELRYRSPDSLVEFDHASVPEGWTITLKEVNDDLDYDSYGNGYSNDASMIIVVSDGDMEATYMLPGEYASYEGWTWRADRIKEVRSVERVVTTWEWLDV